MLLGCITQTVCSGAIGSPYIGFKINFNCSINHQPKFVVYLHFLCFLLCIDNYIIQGRAL